MSEYPATVIPVEVRFRDLDAYGHVNNATFLTYLEQARVKILGEYFALDGEHGKTGFVMRKAELEFLRPITLRSSIYVRMQVTKMGRASFTLFYELMDQAETIYATASTVLVTIDAETGRPAGVPDWFEEAVRRGAERFGSLPQE